MASEPIPALHKKQHDFTFAEMRLRVGDRIQLQLPASFGPERHVVKLIGHLENMSMIVSVPMVNGVRLQLLEHEAIVARIFSGQKAFAFNCEVMRVNTLPFNYMHLTFPEKIQGSIIRKSPRIKTRIIATVRKVEGGEGAESQSAVITNLSNDGAMLQAARKLHEKDQQIILSFQVTLHNMDTLVVVHAIIRNISDEMGLDSSGQNFNHGLEFIELANDKKVILQSLIYQQMIEQPHTVN